MLSRLKLNDLILTILALMACSACVCLTSAIGTIRKENLSQATATAETEKLLTTQFGEEASTIIEEYIAQELSVVSGVEVTRIRVIAYTEMQFKAYAAVRIPNAEGRCGIYVFSQKDQGWEFEVFLRIMSTYDDLARDWDDIKDAYVGFIDEMPVWEPCEYTRW